MMNSSARTIGLAEYVEDLPMGPNGQSQSRSPYLGYDTLQKLPK